MELKEQTGLSFGKLLESINLNFSKFCEWKKVYGQPRVHKAVPKSHWLLPEEKRAIVEFKKEHLTVGYRPLTWMMVDANIAHVSPSSVLRVLTEAGLNNRWTKPAGKPKKQGFDQPGAPHEQWHSDISYINFRGSFLFLIAVLDGFSRTVLSWDIRKRMETFDVDMVVRKAHEQWIEGTDLKPRMITDNGPQYIAIDFKRSLESMNISQTRTSPYHPQSNGKMERFNGTAKQEKIRETPMVSHEQLIEEFGDWVDFYNNERLHSAIGYIAPMDALNGKRDKILKEREEKIKQGKLDRARKNKLILEKNNSSEVA